MNDAALAKLATIRGCLARILAVTRAGANRVRELDTQDIVVLNRQRAIQAAIDPAARLIAREPWDFRTPSRPTSRPSSAKA